MGDFKVSDRLQMKCGSYEAEKRRYHLHIGKSGNRWLVADQPNAGDNVYVEDKDPNSQGFAGRTLTFTLVDGTEIELQGPWHSNSNALFVDTGVDVRDKHRTFGAVGLGMDRRYPACVIKDCVYEDDEPMIGSFNRIKDIAQREANERGCTMYYWVDGCSGPVYPKELD